jgi:rhomboid family GlyGly-CTERM serine protease
MRAPAAAAWPALCAVLALGALGAQPVDTALLDWQPGLAAREPWRWWSAAFVHWSPWHLRINLIGIALVAALGWRTGLGARATAAWALAWPLTHLGLLAQAGLRHYGGLSGVLHAGLAIIACELLRSGAGRARWIGAGLGLGLLVKVISERPWGPPTQAVAGWDFQVAPLAHAVGAIAGLLAWALVGGGSKRPS